MPLLLTRLRLRLVGFLQYRKLIRDVKRGATREGRKPYPFRTRSDDGEDREARGGYQEQTSFQLKAWVNGVAAATASAQARAVARLRTALNKESGATKRAGDLTSGAKAKAPVLTGGKIVTALVLTIIVAVDLVLAWDPLENLGMPGPLTLVAGLGVTAVLTVVTSIIGRCIWTFIHSAEYKVGADAERTLKTISGVGLFLLVALATAFAWLRSESGPWVMWLALSLLSVLLALYLGMMHRDTEDERKLERARLKERWAQNRVIRRGRKLDRVAQISANLGEYQEASALRACNVGNGAFERAWDVHHRSDDSRAAQPSTPDPGLMSGEAILRIVLAPIRMGLADDPLQRHADRIHKELAPLSVKLSAEDEARSGSQRRAERDGAGHAGPDAARAQAHEEQPDLKVVDGEA